MDPVNKPGRKRPSRHDGHHGSLGPESAAREPVGPFDLRLQKAFAGLLSGLALALILLFWRHDIFGDMHFLFIVPILLVFSMLVIYLVSIATERPAAEKLENTTFSRADFKAETQELRGEKWWKNYRVMAGGLLVLSAILLFIFR